MERGFSSLKKFQRIFGIKHEKWRQSFLWWEPRSNGSVIPAKWNIVKFWQLGYLIFDKKKHQPTGRLFEWCDCRRASGEMWRFSRTVHAQESHTGVMWQAEGTICSFELTVHFKSAYHREHMSSLQHHCLHEDSNVPESSWGSFAVSLISCDLTIKQNK